MTTLIKSQIDDIIRRIRETSSAEEIILFGSQAYGNPNNDSDIDLCIITSDKRKK